MTAPRVGHMLAHFPSELLARVCDKVDARTICRLILCGSKALNYKLTAATGITVLRYGRQFPCEPHFLALFAGLRHLEIVGLGGRMPRSVVGIPKSIESISLLFPTAQEIWLETCRAFSDINVDLPNLHYLRLFGAPHLTAEHLPICLPRELRTLIFGGSMDLSSFGSLLPRTLTRFEISSNTTTTGNDLLAFPTNLDTLHCNLSGLNSLLVAQPVFRHLPLTELHLQFESLSEEEMQTLPPTITRLGLDGQFPDSAVKYLPSGLQYLSVVHWRSFISPQFASLLPPGLKHLTSKSQVAESAYAELPRGLASLEVEWRSRCSPETVANLPPNLTSFDLGYMTILSRPVIAFLPRTLRRFVAYRCPLDEDSFRLMPPHMVSFLVSAASPCPLWWLTLLPTTIQEMCITDLALTDECVEYFATHHPECFVGPDFDIKLLQALPTCLPAAIRFAAQRSSTTYKITPNALKYLPRDMESLSIEWGTFWDDDSLAFLPPKLKTLAFASARSFSDQSLRYFPSTLTHLHLPQCHQFTSDICELLPHTSITHLTLESIILTTSVLQYTTLESTNGLINQKTLSSAMMDALKDIHISFTSLTPWKERFTDDSLSSLPDWTVALEIDGDALSEDSIANLQHHQNLTDLRINRLTEISTTSMWSLPVTLTRLDLIWCTTIEDKDMERLPRILTHLDLRYAVQLTDECIAFLPHTLTYLDLSSAQLTDKSAPMLPRHLETLFVDCATYTPAAAISLPRSLTRLSLGNTERFHQADVTQLPPNLKHVQWDWSPELTYQCMTHLPGLTIPEHVFVSHNIRTPQI